MCVARAGLREYRSSALRWQVINEAVSQPEGFTTVAGEGMPKMGTEEFGDMIVHFDIDFPRMLTDEDKEELRSGLHP